MNRKKALLLLFLIKLPLDQVAWNINIPVGFIPLRASEALIVFITILILTTFMLDKNSESERKGFFRNIPSMLIIPISIFMMIFFIKILRGGLWVLSLQQFFKLITGIVVGTFVAKTFNTEEDINGLVKCMLFSTIIISIFSIPAIYSGGGLKIYAPSAGDQYAGTYLSGGVGRYQSATSFVDAFIVNVPAILFASTVLRSKWYKTLCLLTIIFIIVAAFVAASRAGWLSVAITLVTWMIIKRRWKLLIISASCVLIVATAQVFSNPLQRAYQKIAYDSESLGKGELPDNSFGGRPLTWKVYMATYMAAPMLDKLIGSDRMFNSGFNAMKGHDPHNDFINILIRMGIVGLVTILFLYLVTMMYLLKMAFRTKDIYDWNIVFTAILAFITMMIPSFARTGLMNPNFEWVFWTFTMLALKRYMLSTDIEYQSEEYRDINEESENIASAKIRVFEPKDGNP